MSLGLCLLLLAAVDVPSTSTVSEVRSISAAAPTKSRRYALIIGVNRPAKPDQRPLSYADDDAVRFYELFRELPGSASLFSVLDEETQANYPAVVPEAEVPNKDAIFSRLDQIFDRMRVDRKHGLEPELYLIYSGHGYADQRGEGQLALQDGTFSRSELYDRVLSRSPAVFNHLIVDACDAYFFVQSRGDTSEIDELLNARAREFLDRQTLQKYPSTGAILSTASAAETHEWSEIRAGVFSHEVRSAILGAADANEDGLVGYDELEAFVLAAHAGVKHVGASRAVFVRAPERDRGQPVFELAALSRAPSLRLPRTIRGRVAIADELGRRYVDLNKAEGFEVSIRLLPGPQYYVLSDHLEYDVPNGPREISLAMLSGSPPRTVARGAGIASAYSRGLFSVPFGPALLEGFRLGQERQTELVMRAPESSHTLRTAGIVTATGGVVAGGLATAFYFAGRGAKADYDTSSNFEDRVALDAEIRAWDARTSFALGTAITLGVTAAALVVLDAMGVGR